MQSNADIAPTHKHTHLQAAQSRHTRQSLQKSVLFANAGQTTEKGAAGNSVLPQLAVTCKIETECSYQTFVPVDSKVLRNCQLRQHANRYHFHTPHYY
jgi:hypothetical protein